MTYDHHGERFDPYKLDNGENPNHKIDHALLVICEEIEANDCVKIAANTAEAMTGATFDPDRLSVRVDGDTLYVSDGNVEVEVDSTCWQEDMPRMFRLAYSAMADALGRQVVSRQTVPSELLVDVPRRRLDPVRSPVFHGFVYGLLAEFLFFGAVWMLFKHVL